MWEGLKIGIWSVMTGIFFSFDPSREQNPLSLFRLAMHAWILLPINSVGTPFLCERFLLLQ